MCIDKLGNKVANWQWPLLLFTNSIAPFVPFSSKCPVARVLQNSHHDHRRNKNWIIWRRKIIKMACSLRLWFGPVLVSTQINFLRYITYKSPVPTRLFALKHGATMVWGPEIVDKAILHAKREVDRTQTHPPSTTHLMPYTSYISCNWGYILQRCLSCHLDNTPHRKTIPHLSNRFRRSRTRSSSR